MIPEKQSSVLNCPLTVGLFNNSCFFLAIIIYIPHFSTLVAPLTTVPEKGSNFKDRTSNLNKVFASPTVLHNSNPSRPLYLKVDRSSVGVGAVLSQRNSRGRLLTCVFLSRTERIYTFGDWKLFEIKFALEEWHPLL